MVSIRLLDELEYIGCSWEHSEIKKWQEATGCATQFSDCYVDRLKPIKSEFDRIMYEVWGEESLPEMTCDSKMSRAELQVGIKRTQERAGLIGASRQLMSEELMALVRVCGIPIRIRYINGKYASAVMGGRIGKLVTDKMIGGVPKRVEWLKDTALAEVRGYVGLRKGKTQSRYTKVDISMELLSEKPNWAKIQFVADEFIICGDKNIDNRENEIRELKRVGFKTPMMIHLGRIQGAEESWERRIRSTVLGGYKKYGLLCEGIEVLGVKRLKLQREGTPEAVILNCGVDWETRKISGKVVARKFAHDNGQIRVQVDIDEDGGGTASVVLRDAALDIEKNTITVGGRAEIDTAFGYAIW